MSAEEIPAVNSPLESLDAQDDASPPAPRWRVCSFESRRAAEMRSLIERQGGIATIAPSMREVPLGENPGVFSFADELLAGRIDVVVFMTGVGARALLEVIQTRHGREEFLAALDRCCVVVRGPKPTAVLREWGVHIDQRAPEPNTWRELLAVIDAHVPIAGMRVAVQEYGEPNDEFYHELERRGTDVLRVPVYRWALPEETGPLLSAVRSTIAGEFDILMFTSAQQVHNTLQVAEAEGLHNEWIAAARKCVIASIGPTCSESLTACGLAVDLEPSHSKMGHLVREALAASGAVFAAKQSNRSTSP